MSKSNIPYHGNPNSRVFGIIGSTISTDEGKTYIKKTKDTLNDGWVEYIEPSPTPTITPTVSITPSITPTITKTPTITPTRTPTPSQVDIGIFLSSNKFAVNSSPTVYTNDGAILAKSRWKLRVKATEMTGLAPNFGIEQRADYYNLNYAPVDVPPVGDYYTELYYTEYLNYPNVCGTYDLIGVGPKTAVTMSVTTSSGFVPLPYPGESVYLSSSAFRMDDPAYVYTGNSSVLTSHNYKLRCKLVGDPGSQLGVLWGLGPEQRSVAWKNNYSKIIPPGVGSRPAELYWISYNSSYSSTVQPSGKTMVTMSIATASGFVPVTPPAYIPSGHPNVYLSAGTGPSITFDYKNPPYIYTTDPAVLASPAYKLRCKALVWNPSTSTWDLYTRIDPGPPPTTINVEQRAIAWNNQYGQIIPPDPGTYKFELYWVKYDGIQGSITSLYSGTVYSVIAVITQDCSVAVTPTPTPTPTITPSGY